MRKVYLLFLIVGVLIFSGCAPKEVESYFARDPDSDKFIVLVSAGANYDKHQYAWQLQEISIYGLKHGYRYFAIKLPTRISNTEGSTSNTYEDIHKICVEENNDCGENEYGINWLVQYFKKQPVDVVTYDAKAILKDLKKHNLLLEKWPKDFTVTRMSEKYSFGALRSMAPFVIP